MYQQLETWEANPQQFLVGEQPLMTTLDAPFFCVGPRSIVMVKFMAWATSARIHPIHSGSESSRLKLLPVKTIQVEPVAPARTFDKPNSCSVTQLHCCDDESFLCGQSLSRWTLAGDPDWRAIIIPIGALWMAIGISHRRFTGRFDWNFL